jgi:hypothetical protein
MKHPAGTWRQPCWLQKTCPEACLDGGPARWDLGSAPGASRFATGFLLSIISQLLSSPT